MLRSVFTAPMLAIALVLLLPAASAWQPGPAPAAAGTHGIMQCMEKCIREEGKSSKDTCKTKCAPVPSAFGRNQGSGRQPDSGSCMSAYKDCMQGCAKSNKICKRSCKKSLMRCQ